MTHILLQRQLRKATDGQGSIDHEALFSLVAEAYTQYDSSLRLQLQATQLMSSELNDLNAAIRKERDEAIAESQKRFELAVEGSNDGIWDWNVADDTLWFSTRCKAMLGYSAEQLKECRIADWYALVAEADRDEAKKVIQELCQWRMRGGATLRFSHTSGEVRHIMFRAATMQDAHGRVARIVGIHTDITAFISMQESLQTAKEMAEQANVAKSEFLANMSHELRTPLHAILAFSRQGLKRIDAAKDERLAVMISNIQISGNRLLGLLNSLLDLTKLEAGKMDFEFVSQDIRKAIDHALLEAEVLAQMKQIRVAVMCDEGTVTTLAYDLKTMVQVLINLLSNAIKFSPPGSEITVALSQAAGPSGEDALLCRVRDQGVGIPEGELESVFDKFVQSSKTKSGAGGTGLGLSIARQIAQAHGGKLWAENDPGSGACFSLRLPYEQAAPAE